MLAKVTRGNQITIPKFIVKKARLDFSRNPYLNIDFVGGAIILRPVSIEEGYDDITDEQWEKFEKWSKTPQKGDVRFETFDEAIDFLKKRMKKD